MTGLTASQWIFQTHRGNGWKQVFFHAVGQADCSDQRRAASLQMDCQHDPATAHRLANPGWEFLSGWIARKAAGRMGGVCRPTAAADFGAWLGNPADRNSNEELARAWMRNSALRGDSLPERKVRRSVIGQRPRWNKAS